MNIDNLEWTELGAYLAKARGQSKSTVINHRSRFKSLKAWFADREFNSKTLSHFLEEAEKNGKSPSYQNNILKLAKHIEKYLGQDLGIRDFQYVDENHGSPENILSAQQITELAEVDIKYWRYKDRKIKLKTLIYFLGTVGSRINETLLLEWKDVVETPLPMIHFRKEVTKTRRERYCPIPKWLLELVLSLPKENQYIFSKIETTNLREDLEKRRLKCLIPFRVTPHTFRDSSINNKLDYGIQLEQVSAYHGHTKIDTTYKYYVRIRARQLAQTLQTHDPAFQSDLTYESCAETAKELVERMANPRLVHYTYEYNTNESNKKEIKFTLTER